jgi:hypothetical protein
MHYSLKQVLMMGSVIAFVGTTACSTIEATASLDGGDEAVTQGTSGGDILGTMAHDSEAGGE